MSSHTHLHTPAILGRSATGSRRGAHEAFLLLRTVFTIAPIAFGLGLELFHHETTINAPSTQWWISLSSAIVYGLSFATVLTLVVTPAALMVFTREHLKPGETRRSFWQWLFRRKPKEASETIPEALPAPAE